MSLSVFIFPFCPTSGPKAEGCQIILCHTRAIYFFIYMFSTSLSPGHISSHRVRVTTLSPVLTTSFRVLQPLGLSGAHTFQVTSLPCLKRAKGSPAPSGSDLAARLLLSWLLISALLPALPPFTHNSPALLCPQLGGSRSPTFAGLFPPFLKLFPFLPGEIWLARRGGQFRPVILSSTLEYDTREQLHCFFSSRCLTPEALL